MQLNALDWVVIFACLLFSFAPALFFARRAGKGTAEFFASGRAAPWWLAGTSMVATTFSTDTPNLVTQFVREDGVYRNWVWWAFLLTGMMTVFFYARLWRRSGVLTDLEFYEIRYGGKSAAFVRGFRSIYLGLFFNCVIMATVTLAAIKIANVMLGWDRLTTVLTCSAICISFSVLSGLWGVLVSDIVQFVIAMVGVLAAAYYALDHEAVGGMAGLVEKIDPARLAILPDFANRDLFLAVLIIPVAVQWWSVWYPGAEPGGGSYVAQRMLAAKNEKHAVGATLWFNIAHYSLRPWPWIIVALCSLLVFPQLADIKAALPAVEDDLLKDDIAYPAMLTLLPHGLLGLLIASLTSAYVSTMSTHLNWGASYLVHDFYRRFLRSDADEHHYVRVSRLVTAGLMAVAAAFSFVLSTAGDGFTLLLEVGAGTGLIYLLRWYWWRISAVSEIVAMAASFGIAAGLFVGRRYGWSIGSHEALMLSVGLTTACWVLATLIAPAADRAVLISFCRLVRPAGPGWRVIRQEGGVEASSDSLPQALLGWLLGCTCVYSAMFGVGNFLYGKKGLAAVFAGMFVVSGVGLWRVLLGMLGEKKGRDDVTT